MPAMTMNPPARVAPPILTGLVSPGILVPSGRRTRRGSDQTRRFTAEDNDMPGFAATKEASRSAADG
jgi:hypothetical protein